MPADHSRLVSAAIVLLLLTGIVAVLAVAPTTLAPGSVLKNAALAARKPAYSMHYLLA